jgi:hypothetical protein
MNLSGSGKTPLSSKVYNFLCKTREKTAKLAMMKNVYWSISYLFHGAASENRLS